MRILIVEDEPEIVRFLTLELQHEGYETESCPDGKSGLERALNGGFDLVLLDVMLPGSIDGLEVCRRLRADPSQAGVKVLLLSARGLPADLQAGRRAGADACLVKPCSPIDLLEQIESMLG